MGKDQDYREVKTKTPGNPPSAHNQILMSGKAERVMDENHEFDDNTKRVVASNLTAAYFATVEKQTRHVNPDGPERMEIYNQIKRVYSDFLSVLEPLT